MAKSVSAIFRHNLRALRKARGWSQYQAAEKTGVGQKVWGHYESGEKNNPTLRTLERVARTFSVSVPQLLSPMEPRLTRGAKSAEAIKSFKK